jgi:hypothetical protein
VATGRPSRGLARAAAGLAVAAVCAVCAPLAQGRPLIGVTEAAFGGAAGTLEAQRADELGSETFRLSISWAEVQPRAGGGFNWGIYDDLADGLRKRGIRPILLVVNTPSWAQSGSDLCGGAPQCPPAPGSLPSWAAFVRAAVEHFGTGSTSLDPIGVEVWNEENVRTNWRSFRGPDPGRYAELLRSAAAASRAVRPDLPIVLGGLATGADGAAWYIYELARLGARDAYDVIGLHPYPDPGPGDSMSTMLATYDAAMSGVRAARDATGDGAKPLWITEVGIVDPDQVFAGQSQASEILAMYDEASAQPDVGVFVIHRLRNGMETQQWGLLNPDWSPRQSFADLASRFTADRAAARAAAGAAGTAPKRAAKKRKPRCKLKRSHRTGRKVRVCPKKKPKRTTKPKTAPARKSG